MELFSSWSWVDNLLLSAGILCLLMGIGSLLGYGIADKTSDNLIEKRPKEKWTDEIYAVRGFFLAAVLLGFLILRLLGYPAI